MPGANDQAKAVPAAGLEQLATDIFKAASPQDATGKWHPGSGRRVEAAGSDGSVARYRLALNVKLAAAAEWRKRCG